MSYPNSPEWYDNERASGRFWVTDPIYQCPTSDLGIGLQAAIVDTAAARGGEVIVPALPVGQAWTWVTNVSFTGSAFVHWGMTLSLRSESALIQLALADNSRSACYLANFGNGTLRARGFNLLGSNSVSIDCASVE